MPGTQNCSTFIPKYSSDTSRTFSSVGHQRVGLEVQMVTLHCVITKSLSQRMLPQCFIPLHTGAGNGWSRCSHLHPAIAAVHSSSWNYYYFLFLKKCLFKTKHSAKGHPRAC